MKQPVTSRILVPLDGSREAETVVPELCRFLPPDGARLILLRIIPGNSCATREDAEKDLRRLAARWSNRGIPVTVLVRKGAITSTILDAAESQQATLTALAAHRGEGIPETLLHISRVPLFLAPLPAPRTNPRPPRNFLLPLDGSPEALDALDPLLALTHGSDARVRLLQVDEATPYLSRWEHPDPIMKHADQILREACIPTTIDLRRGDPAQQILKVAAEENIDLVAMSTHGRSGFPLWFRGSVTADVLRRLSSPLLVTRRTIAGSIAQNPGQKAQYSPPE